MASQSANMWGRRCRIASKPFVRDVELRQEDPASLYMSILGCNGWFTLVSLSPCIRTKWCWRVAACIFKFRGDGSISAVPLGRILVAASLNGLCCGLNLSMGVSDCSPLCIVTLQVSGVHDFGPTRMQPTHSL